MHEEIDTINPRLISCSVGLRGKFEDVFERCLHSEVVCIKNKARKEEKEIAKEEDNEEEQETFGVPPDEEETVGSERECKKQLQPKRRQTTQREDL